MATAAERLQYAEILAEIGELYDAEAVVAEVLDEPPEDRTALDLCVLSRFFSPLLGGNPTAAATI